jgi:hypothetical protein
VTSTKRELACAASVGLVGLGAGLLFPDLRDLLAVLPVLLVVLLLAAPAPDLWAERQKRTRAARNRRIAELEYELGFRDDPPPLQGNDAPRGSAYYRLGGKHLYLPRREQEHLQRMLRDARRTTAEPFYHDPPPREDPIDPSTYAGRDRDVGRYLAHAERSRAALEHARELRNQTRQRAHEAIPF